jgi:ribonuclease E
MANKMLIDASHPEETRVVVLRGNRIEEFDFESASKKPLRGNIYLAKVTRVEPSLQAAFIEYGGNRHGFLAFSEIHPDYYQIPVADRQALLEAEQQAHQDEEEEENKPQRRSGNTNNRRRRRHPRERRNRDEMVIGEASVDGGIEGAKALAGAVYPLDADQPGAGEPAQAGVAIEQPSVFEPAQFVEQPQAFEQPQVWTPLDAPAPVPDMIEAAPVAQDQIQEDQPQVAKAQDAAQSDAEEPRPVAARADVSTPSENDDEDEDEDDEDDQDGEGNDEEEHVEQLGGDDFEEMPVRAVRQRKQYKIQEVIRRRQVLLVQVVKEERGNKGAALTTYLSLAGRYSVLMPNTARGGGISRKITDNDDRKRLKEIASELEVPEGMGVILRTAGASRTKPEVRRDFEYLLRMWESVRSLTLESSAPSLVYEEGSLIKRSIRDLYGKEIDEVVVAGPEGFKEARDYMGMLSPSHVRNVKPWTEPQPLFAHMGVEAQLDSMFSAQVTLKSGGYIVINQTEALVAIDVNSGRSTREHNIEDTALRTNLEASDEVARQLRLRDLAGLIVVDFIDMEENRNNRAVERRIKEALKNDRARIQVGRISHFGLLEMSRQRMRTGVLEGSSVVCPHCSGAGTVRSTASMALHVLRVIEDSLVRNAQFNMTARTRSIVALYILNQKRTHLRELEERFGVTITIDADDSLMGGVYHALERGELASPPPVVVKRDFVRLDSIAPMPELDEDLIDESEDDEEEADEKIAPSRPERTRTRGERAPRAEAAESDGESEEDGENGRRRRRRRRRRNGRDRDSSGVDSNAPQPSDDALATMAGIGASIGGDLPGLSLPAGGDGEVDETEAAAEGEAAQAEGDARRSRRRRPRRGRGEAAGGEASERAPGSGSWVRSSDHAEPNFVIEQPPVDLTNAETQQPVVQEIVQALAPKAAEVTAPVEAPASVEAKAPVQALAPAPAAAPELAPAPEPAPVREAEALPEAPVPEQKKSGWWQRAKSQITGN